MALETITFEHRNFQQISIHAPYHPPSIVDHTNLKKTLGEPHHRQWMVLDLLLVQFWELRAIRPKIVCGVPREKKWVYEYVGSLLPEITKRGIIDLVQ